MKKKKSSGGGANWMDTYGDMVTLLLCFFVLLYSLSSISEDNWKALVMSFNPNADLSPRENEGGDGPSADGDEQGVAPTPQDDLTQNEIDVNIEELYMAISAYAAQAGVTETVSVSKDGGKIYINFNGTAFFNGDTYALRADALPILDNMAEMLSRSAWAIDEVRVIGHTAQGDPNVPNNISTDRFLASNRATNVLIYIQQRTNADVLDPAKLISEGWGQWHPIDTNDTNAGRAANRRVEMIISGRNLEQEMEETIQSYTTTP